MSHVTNHPPPSPSDLRAAQLASVLAQAVREDRLQSADAMRVLRHELRRRYTNKKLGIQRRSAAAQAVIDEHAAAGTAIPNNNSLDALHADHVHALTTLDLETIITVDDWVVALARLREVVCVTAEQNYQLQAIEKTGITGPDKYSEAGIKWARIGP